MKSLTLDDFNALLKQDSTVKPRIKRALRFNSSVNHMTADSWQTSEIVAIWDKSHTFGVLLMQPYDELYMVGFETGSLTRDSTGRSKAVICDFCYTWRKGGDAGLVTFYSDSHSNNSTSQLCCYDFDCSRHVRTLTNASVMSRAQLREHMTTEDRVERLKTHLHFFADKISLQPST